jgi:hypothetical protein
MSTIAELAAFLQREGKAAEALPATVGSVTPSGNGKPPA